MHTRGSSSLAWGKGPVCCVPLPRAGPRAGWFVYSPVLCGSSLVAQQPAAGTLAPANVSLRCLLQSRRVLQRPFTLNPFILVSLSPLSHSAHLPSCLPPFPFFSLSSSQLPSLSPFPFASLSPDSPSPSLFLSIHAFSYSFFSFFYFMSSPPLSSPKWSQFLSAFVFLFFIIFFPSLHSFLTLSHFHPLSSLSFLLSSLFMFPLFLRSLPSSHLSHPVPLPCSCLFISQFSLHSLFLPVRLLPSASLSPLAPSGVVPETYPYMASMPRITNDDVT